MIDSMATHLPTFGNLAHPFPLMGVGYWQHGSMRPRDVLAANLRKLMAAAPGLSRLPEVVEASSGALTNGTLDRVRRATHATSIDTLETIAEVFGVEPWHLLVPTLHVETAKDQARAKVKVSGLPEWPFARVDRQRFANLEPEQRAFIEGMIANELALLESPNAEDVRRFATAHTATVKPKQKKRAA